MDIYIKGLESLHWTLLTSWWKVSAVRQFGGFVVHCWAFDLPIPLVCGSPLSFTASLDISYYAPRPLPRCYLYVGHLDYFLHHCELFTTYHLLCHIYYSTFHAGQDTEIHTTAIFVKSEKFHSNPRLYDKRWSHVGVLSRDLQPFWGLFRRCGQPQAFWGLFPGASLHFWSIWLEIKILQTLYQTKPKP